MYKPYHLIGLELGISICRRRLRGEPTGADRAASAAMWRRSPSARCSAGETLDGEGGYTVCGKLCRPRSLREGALPIGLAHKVRLLRDVSAGEIVRWSDVEAPTARPCAPGGRWSAGSRPRSGRPQSDGVTPKGRAANDWSLSMADDARMPSPCASRIGSPTPHEPA